MTKSAFLEIDDQVPVVIRSAEEQVYEVLRDQIANGLEPGSPLQPAAIAASLGVSVTPVRAALLRLENDGLVRHEPRRVAIVAPLELEDLEEIQAMRAGVTALAARLGAERIDAAALARMRALLDTLAAEMGSRDIERYLQTVNEFEDECFRAAGRPRLLRLVQTYRLLAQRYLLFGLGGTSDFRMEANWEFFDAVSHHDGERVERDIHKNLRRTFNEVASRLSGGLAPTAGEAAGPPDLAVTGDRIR
jgi:DNA-binding GntR family transcriptional regulator